MPLYSPFGKVIGSIPRISGHIFQATAMAGLYARQWERHYSVAPNWENGRTRNFGTFFAAEQQVWISREPFDE